MSEDWEAFEDEIEEFLESGKGAAASNGEFQRKAIEILYNVKDRHQRQGEEFTVGQVKEDAECEIDVFIARMERAGFLELEGENLYESKIVASTYTRRELEDADSLMEEIGNY